MLIKHSYAATDIPVPPPTSDTLSETQSPVAADTPSVTEAFAWNMGMVLVLVLLFYVLLIKPQQRRFREHSIMLSGLKKGDKVIAAGGLIGTIEKISEGSDEVVVDLGNGMKVTALRSAIQAKDDPKLRPAKSQKNAEKA